MLSVRAFCIVISLLMLVACEHTETKRPTYLNESQLRAVLTQENGQWIATDCSNKTERFQLVDDVNITSDAEMLMNKSKKDHLFVDVIGTVNNQATATAVGSFTVKHVNRLTTDITRGCGEGDFNRIIVRTIGKNPLWVASVAPKGIVVERVNQNPLVLPYVDERLPDGQMNFATEGDGQKIQLWVAPERCVDGETGDIYSLRAILTVNYQTFQGCGYLGKASGVLGYK